MIRAHAVEKLPVWQESLDVDLRSSLELFIEHEELTWTA